MHYKQTIAQPPPNSSVLQQRPGEVKSKNEGRINFCPKCGSKIGEGNVFCQNCGNKI